MDLAKEYVEEKSCMPPQQWEELMLEWLEASLVGMEFEIQKNEIVSLSWNQLSMAPVKKSDAIYFFSEHSKGNIF